MRAGLVRTRTNATLAASGVLLVWLLVSVDGPRAAAQPAPLEPREQTAVQIAIDRGVQYLQRSQNPGGSWGTGTGIGSGGGWAVGYTALAGLTLVECGVPTTDPGLKKAARIVRDGARQPKFDSTYEVALAILFLDRMGDPNDRRLIQTLAVRLIAGQSQSGGWAYKVPLPGDAETNQILAALRKLNTSRASGLSFRERPSSVGLCIKMSDDIRPRPSSSGPGSVAEAEDPKKAEAAVIGSLPPGIRRMNIFQDPDRLNMQDPEGKGQEAFNGTTDNSNTHFATLGLWAARRHDVPTERTYSLLVRRFRTSQNPDGTWAYAYANGGKGGGAGAMTGVALLVLAIGHVLGVDEGAPAKLEQDPQVLNGLKALSGRVGAPVGEFQNRPAPKDIGGLYFMWAMERIAVLYDLRTLGNKDWYRWGMEILVAHQQADGSWLEGGYPGQHPVVNTCLALMFLKRANLTPDLSRRLTVDAAALAEQPAPAPQGVPFVIPNLSSTPEAPKAEEPAPTPT
ncbi:MAG TPA: hypothetical protein VKE74_09020, partial [Gemmataceae bacterium]|nr:hypothetical protein [Gemmataceae bacterium]